MKTVSIVSMAVVLFAFQGCASDLQNFVGVWDLSGTTMFMVSGQAPNVIPVKENMTIIEGNDSDLVLPIMGCNVPATVNGEAATIRSGYSCVTQVDSLSVTITFSNGVAMVREGAMSFDATGTVAVLYNGQTYPGSISVNDTAVRLGK